MDVDATKVRQPNPFVHVVRAVWEVAQALPVAGRSYVVGLWAYTAVVALAPVGIAVATANAVGASPGVLRDGLDSPAGDRLRVALACFVGLFVVQSAISAFGEVFCRRLERRLDGLLRERVMTASMTPTGIRHVEDPGMQRAMDVARNVSGFGFTPGLTAPMVVPVVSSRIRVAAYLVVLFYLWWPFGLLMVGVTVLNQDQMSKTAVRLSAGIRLNLPLTYPNYHRDLAITPGAAKEVRIFGFGPWLRDRFVTSVDALAGQTRAITQFDRPLTLTLLLNGASAAFGVGWFGLAAARGDVGVGEVALAVAAIMSLAPHMPVPDLVLNYGTSGMAQIRQADEIAGRTDLDVPGERPAAGMPAHGVRFEQVSFHYPGSDVDVLTDLDLELRSGERTALVGLNGAGKTTLVKLLCKLYEPTAGQITVDGVPLGEIDPIEWRRQLAVLFQDFVHYELPARDNVGFGAVAQEATDERLGRAARAVGADEVMDHLPAGWETPLSSRFEGGVDLSGGEWQRVAFARALYSVGAGARVLVLDEPTANLDVRAEAEMYDHFVDLTGGEESVLTTLLVSHRFSTVRRADRIVVLDGGRVRETGSHAELVTAGDLYARMFAAQASRFADGVETPAAEEEALP